MPCFSECTKATRRKILVLSENRKEARFENLEGDLINVTRFDGCVECAGRRADFVVQDAESRTLVLELKGKALEEAVKQVQETLVYLRANVKLNGRASVLVVCAKVPLGVSSVQKLVAELKSFGFGKIKFKSRAWSGRLSDLL